jgi:DNA-binding transcriptional ArsR family regulator
MGATKKHLYSRSRLQIADMYKALGHPARVTLVEYILKHEGVNVLHLERSIGLSKSNVSRHLAILHKTGIIGYEVMLNNCIYKINPQAVNYLTEHLTYLSEHSHELGSYDYCPAID